MPTTRRALLAWAAKLGITATVPHVLACGTREPDGADDGLPEYEWEGPPGPETIFAQGLASGDPTSDAVILWTRAAVEGEPRVELFVEVALGPDFSRRVYAGYHEALASADYTFKLDVEGLSPGTTYYYRFFAQGRQSPIGRTRTAPSGAVERLRFAVCSCSNYRGGYFHAYRRIAERADLAAVLHLGDYIYESGGSAVRAHDPPYEILTLADYRRRYAQYRGDADLADAHRQHPWIVVWDDHESANDAWFGGAENHQPNEGSWEERKAAAIQAYFEYMPLRFQVSGQIYRSLAFGELVELFMLDTRLAGRDAQVPITSPDLGDPQRQLLGAAQETWLLAALSGSNATWKLLGQQVMFGHLYVPGSEGMGPLNADQWDGYPAARQRVLGHVRAEGIGGLVVLTGDIHSSWAVDLAEDPFDADRYDEATGAGALGVELVTTAVTSSGFPEASASVLANTFVTRNPHIKWCELTQRGYLVVDVTPARIHGDWFFVDDVTAPDGGAERFAKAAYYELGGPGVRLADAPLEPEPAPPDLAP